MAAPRPEHAHATNRPATATLPPRPAHTTTGWRQDRRPVVSKRPLHNLTAAKMSPHIHIGPEEIKEIIIIIIIRESTARVRRKYCGRDREQRESKERAKRESREQRESRERFCSVMGILPCDVGGGLGLGVGVLGWPRAGVDGLWRLCCGVAVGGPFAGCLSSVF